MQIGYLPWRRSEAHSGRPCIEDGRTALTYGQFRTRVEACAEQLRAAGVGRGDVVAVMLPNRVELAVALFGAWRLGAAATPLNPALTPAEAEQQILDCGARVVVNLDGLSPDAGRPTITLGNLRAEPSGDLPPVENAADDLALVTYAPGSGGRPTGVMLSHGNLCAAATQLAEHLRITDEDHCLVVLPLFGCATVVDSLLTPMLAGARVSVMRSFQSEPFLWHVASARPTYFSGVPAVFSLLASLPDGVVPDTSSLRLALGWPAPLSEELVTRFEARLGLPLVERYGPLEAACCTACSPLDGRREPGSVGPALPGQEIRIVDADGHEVPHGVEGEIVVTGPTVMQGVDGWLHTGDAGRLEEDGHLVLVDRPQGPIRRNGECVRPQEIETALHQVAGVSEAAVIGRAAPDVGQVPVAFVALHPESDLTADHLLDHCRTALPEDSVPVEITVLRDDPTDRAGVG